VPTDQAACAAEFLTGFMNGRPGARGVVIVDLDSVKTPPALSASVSGDCRDCVLRRTTAMMPGIEKPTLRNEFFQDLNA